VGGRLVLASRQVEPNDSIGFDDTKGIHAFCGNIDTSLGRSRCYEEHFLGLDELAKAIINVLELGHRRIS